MNFFRDLIKKNLVTFIIIGVLFLGVVVSSVVFMLSLKRKNTVENKIKSELFFLQGFKMAKENAPTSEWVDYLNKKSQMLQETFDSIMVKLDKPPTRMPESVKESLKFKEEIFETQKKLRDKAYAKQLELREGAISLGFKEYEKKIPQEEEVPNLTKQIDIIQELIHLMCISKVETVEKIEFYDYKDYTLESENKDKITLRVFFVKLELVASVKNLAEFFYWLSKSDFIFIVEELNVNSLTDLKTKVKSDFLVSSVVFLKE